MVEREENSIPYEEKSDLEKEKEASERRTGEAMRQELQKERTTRKAERKEQSR